ncbi:ABC-2 type transport system permease protein [Allocatelliglobosispora scoriae]|uniref:ABC-2 type transport system permease protein n=1 Tax=Allocatelliglobosispora scoriae TaxID=643052 RepID=A0A841BVR5_9ACTN|nr:ABC-2 family transporter protein [Allocatelliglobosispora scoriae]MBB5872264.1 ABC-2 type transport system permease protein [Allocatelliglobosispora scoriae]
MRAYLRFAALSLRTGISYSTAIALGTLGRCFQLLATVAIWGALLANGGTLGGFDLPEMKAYLLVGFVVNVLGSTVGDWAMAQRIHSGMIALDLVRPINYQATQFAATLGGVVLDLVVIVVAGGGFVLLAQPIEAPQHWGLLLASLLLVVPLKFLIVYLSTLICFYTQNYHGVFWAREAIWLLLSGAMVPLALLPDAVQLIASLLPFAAVMSTPALIYLGKVSTADAVGLIAIQVGWVAGLWLVSRLAWRGASRRLTVHGG